MRTRAALLPVLALLALPLAACGGDDEGRGVAAPSDEGPCASPDADSLLAEICDKGVLTVSTDPAYPPQSSLNEQTGEYEGFDIDVATEIANRLGVDVAWEAPVVGRHHRRQLERSLGHQRRLDDADQRPAGGPRLHRALLLHARRRRGARPTTTSVTDLTTDLDGKTIGVCSGCTYEQFLDKDLDIEGFDVRLRHRRRRDLRLRHRHHRPAGPRWQRARLDAVITVGDDAQGYIDAGNPVKIVGDPVFYEPLAVASTRAPTPSSRACPEAVDAIVGGDARGRHAHRAVGEVVRPGPT